GRAGAPTEECAHPWRDLRNRADACAREWRRWSCGILRTVPLMVRLIDRYLLRELIAPFAIALLMLTFALEIPPIIQQGEGLIAKGVAWGIVARVLVTLVPQALGITIPMALLVGMLIALGRLSGDREIV